MKSTVRIGMRSPWGTVNSAQMLADGIGTVGTPSHGGIKLSAKRNHAVPEYMRQSDGWYEEDCDWCVPFVVFEADIILAEDEYALKNINDGSHKRTFRNHHPDAFEKFYGVELKAGESYMRDEAARRVAIRQQQP